MRKIAKGTQEAFVKQVQKMIKEIGATIIEPRHSESWSLETEAGILELHLPHSDHIYCFSLFGRFKDIDKANEVLGKHFGHNVYSGKWNFHLSPVPKKDLPNIVGGMQTMIETLLP